MRTPETLSLAVILVANTVGAQERNRHGEIAALSAFMERSIRAGDTAGFDKVFAIDRLIARSTRGLELRPEVVDGFALGIRQSFGPGKRLEAATRKGSYTLLRVQRHQGKSTAVFRLVGPRGTLNYHEMLFEDVDGKPRVVDYFNFTTGELHSETLRRLLLLMGSSTVRRVGSHLRRMQDLHRNGDAAAALRMYKALPKSLRREKPYLLMRVQCASMLGAAEHLLALRAYERLIPETDPSRTLMLMDLFQLRAQFGKAVDNVDRLARRVGGDPYLLALRAGLLTRAGKLEEARQDALAAVAAAPRLAPAHIALIEASLLQGTHADTSRFLARFDLAFTIRMKGLQKLRGFTRFLGSPEGRAWREEFDAMHMRPKPKPQGSQTPR